MLLIYSVNYARYFIINIQYTEILHSTKTSVTY